MTLQKMYPSIPFSPSTILTQDIGEGDTIIYVADVNVFPEGPNLATIGIDESAETIEYAQKIPGALSGCTRGVEGQARAWLTNEVIARNFTAKDYETLVENVETLESNKQPVGDYATNEALEEHVNDETNPHQVTTEQIGAATQEEVNTLKENADAHIANFNNPHQVTAKQIGAATTGELPPIKFYTTLEQMGLSDADMAEDDFIGNLAKISNKTHSRYIFILMDINNVSFYPNLMKSINKQLTIDNVTNADVPAVTLKIERVADAWRAIKIELFVENGYGNLTNEQARQKTIIAYANRDGDTMYFYPFREVAKIQPVIDITPLNGWEFRWFKMTKVGNIVTLIFTSKGVGVLADGTVIGIVPEGYRPIENCSVSMSHNGSNHQGRIAIDTAGNIKIYNITDATDKIDSSGSFITN